MLAQNLFKKRKDMSSREKADAPSVPDGLVCKCPQCKRLVFSEDVSENGDICPKCGSYFRMSAEKRLLQVTDRDTFIPWFEGMPCKNPLEVEGYPEKVESFRESTGLDEAVLTGEARISGYRVAIGICDSHFFMASMGHVVGEKLTLMIERATREKLPVIIFAASGGARMQEGMISLMQMAKTSAALKRHSDGGNLYVSVLTDPTTGGVTASFAMLGDIILAEPGALIGFAGRRVIAQTIGQKLPEGFQSAEFLLEHGFIDAIVERKKMKAALTRILCIHQVKVSPDEQVSAEVLQELQPSSGELSAWERVQISRKNDRPAGTDYLRSLFVRFLEMHGDRCFGDDRAIIGGIARFHGHAVTVIAQAKGHNTKENVLRNFGMPSPEGYRKALRLMKQAEKFNRPVICFVDTPGAFCGIEAEERGQGEAIARCLYEMSALKVPVLSVIIGEGGSGGALAMAVAGQVWMLENAVYSVLSPEGYASILWKDSRRAPEAAQEMHLTAGDLKKLGIIDEVIPEPDDYTLKNMASVMQQLDRRMLRFVEETEKMSPDEVADQRYQRFRKF